jgi:hypothetical protein
MNFLFRIFLLAAIVFVIQFYFSKRITGALKTLFNQIDEKKLKLYKRLILPFFNLYPAIGLIYLIYYQATSEVVIFPPPYFLFDLFIQFPFWIYVLIVIQSVLFFILFDITRILLIPFFRDRKGKKKLFFARLYLLTAVIFLAYVPIRVLYDYNSVSTRVIEYEKVDLPKTLDGFRIALIADVQADRYTDKSRLEKYIASVNEINPDLVLIAGDVITSTPDYINLAAEMLGRIKSKYGIYSCIGDHDNWAYRGDSERSLKEISDALRLKNIRMIDNQKIKINVDTATVEITFVTNTYVEKISDTTINQLTNHSKHEDVSIFLTHQPREFLIDYAAKAKYDLFLAGHTHGGQITFFFPFINLSPTLIETKYVRGDFATGNMLAVVNRGLGMSLVPIRYNSTPEVTLIVLSRQQNKGN